MGRPQWTPDMMPTGASNFIGNEPMFRAILQPFTSLSLIACLAISALWVRSFWWMDRIGGADWKRWDGVLSVHGRIQYGRRLDLEKGGRFHFESIFFPIYP